MLFVNKKKKKPYIHLLLLYTSKRKTKKIYTEKKNPEIPLSRLLYSKVPLLLHRVAAAVRTKGIINNSVSPDVRIYEFRL